MGAGVVRNFQAAEVREYHSEWYAISGQPANITDAVPPDVEFGFHLSYGDLEHKHGVQPADLSVCVDMTSGIPGAAAKAR